MSLVEDTRFPPTAFHRLRGLLFLSISEQHRAAVVDEGVCDSFALLFSFRRHGWTDFASPLSKDSLVR